MRGTLSRWITAVGAVIALSIACGGVAPFDSPCQVNGCPNGQKCDVILGCVQCTINADCSRPTPMCVPGLGRCGSCLRNADCPSSNPACWPSDHNCHLACNTNADCPSQGSHICDKTAATTVGLCVGCRPGWVTMDCGVGATCNPANGQCVGCTNSNTCPTDHPRCHAATGVCVECESNGDCGSNSLVCDANANKCRTGCTSSAQCSGDTAVCNTATSVCVQCASDADCALRSGKRCGPGNLCTACLTNGDCPSSSPVCRNGACGQ